MTELNCTELTCFNMFPGSQLVNNLAAVWETWVVSLGWEDPLEKGRLLTPVF